MKPLTLAAAAAGLAVAHAFVVVPEIAAADSDIVNALPFSAPAASQSRTLSLDCPGCPVHFRHHGKVHTADDVPSHLELTFAIDEQASSGDRLLLNGFELYPNPDPWHGSLTAPQVLDFLETATNHPHRRGRRPRRPHLGYTLAIHPVAREEDGQQLELVDVELRIIEVGGVFVEHLPTVRARLIRTPAGQLMIADLQAVEAAKVPSDGVAAAPDGQACETLVCRWRAFVNAHMKHFKGLKHCGGGHMRPGAHKSMPRPEADGSRVIHNHYHTWRQLFKNITSYILLPVLIGIVAGVSLSIIGMMVGTLVVFVWRLVVRRQTPWARRHCRRRGHSCHKVNQTETPVVTEEKSGLMEHQEPPPEYEAADPTEEQQAGDARV